MELLRKKQTIVNDSFSCAIIFNSDCNYEYSGMIWKICIFKHCLHDEVCMPQVICLRYCTSRA